MRIITCKDIESKIVGTVTSHETWNLKTGEPHPQGLFSYEIFGKSPIERSTNFGKINIPIPILHPFVFDILKAKKSKLIQHIMLLKPWFFDTEVRLFDTEDEAKSKGYISPYYGLTALLQNYESVLKLLNVPEITTLLTNYPDKIIIDCIPVIPPQYRGDSPDLTHPITEYYIRLIKSVYSLNKKELNPTDKESGATVNTLQRQVYDIYEAIIESFKGDNGLIKKTLLGKRHDYTGRAVVSPDPDILPNQLKVPIRILVRVFEPYIIKQLRNEMPLNKIVQLINQIYFHPDTRELYNRSEELKKIIDTTMLVSKDKYILMKRDPVIHRYGIQAFTVIPDFDNTIKVNPIVTKSFNMDFDGDTAAVFTVFTEEARKELEKLANPYYAATVTKLKYSFEKDYVYTFKVLTLNNLEDDEIKGLDDELQELYKKDKVFGIQTTVGRRKLFELLPPTVRTDKLFELLFPNDKPYIDPNDVITNLQIELDDVNLTLEYITKVVKVLNEYIPIVSEVVTIDELINAYNLRKYIEKEAEKLKTLEDKAKFLDEISSKVLKQLEKNSSIKKLLKTGSVKKVQLIQLLVAKGAYTDILGNKNISFENLASGLSEDQLFESGNIARYGIAARTIKVAEPGRLFKDMSYIFSTTRLSNEVEDCGTTKLVKIDKADKDTIVRLFGRNVIVDGQRVQIGSGNYKDLIGKTLFLRSPIYCKSEDICLTCYGHELFNKVRTTEIGLLAANSIGERLYQEIMRVFHIAGHIKLVRPDFYDLVINKLKTDEKKVKEYFAYNPQTYEVVANKKLVIELSREIYEDVYKAIYGDDNDDIEVSNLVFSVLEDEDSDKQVLSVILPATVLLNISDEVTIKKNSDSIFLIYEKGTRIMTMELSAVDVGQAFQNIYLILLRGHKLNVEDPEVLLLHLYNSMKQLGTVDLIHLELILSVLLRNKEDPYRQARLVEPYRPELYNIYTVMKYEAPLLGGLRTNLKDAVRRTVISGKTNEHKSTIAKIVGLA